MPASTGRSTNCIWEGGPSDDSDWGSRFIELKNKQIKSPGGPCSDVWVPHTTARLADPPVTTIWWDSVEIHVTWKFGRKESIRSMKVEINLPSLSPCNLHKFTVYTHFFYIIATKDQYLSRMAITILYDLRPTRRLWNKIAPDQSFLTSWPNLLKAKHLNPVTQYWQ